MSRSLKGMILAAGMGTRLLPLTRFLAKPAIPFLNRPLIEYSLELLRQSEIRDIAINLHHLPETVKSVLGSSGDSVRLSFEEKILGTAGGIKALQDFFGDSTVVLINGKIYFEQGLDEVIEFHQRQDALVTMVVVSRSGNEEFNPVLVDEKDFRIVGFHRGFSLPGAQSSSFSHYVYTGVQIIEPEVIQLIPDGVSDTVRDIYPRLIPSGKVRAFISQNYWCESSTPERYLSKSIEVLERKKMPCLSDSEVAGNCFHSVLGSEVVTENDTEIRNSVIWGLVKIGRNSRISNSIIGGGPINLPENLTVESAIVTPWVPGVKDTGDLQIKREQGLILWPLRQ